MGSFEFLDKNDSCKVIRWNLFRFPKQHVTFEEIQYGKLIRPLARTILEVSSQPLIHMKSSSLTHES